LQRRLKILVKRVEPINC